MEYALNTRRTHLVDRPATFNMIVDAAPVTALNCRAIELAVYGNHAPLRFIAILSDFESVQYAFLTGRADFEDCSDWIATYTTQSRRTIELAVQDNQTRIRILAESATKLMQDSVDFAGRA